MNVHERPVMLEPFACEGGATSGYMRAGWDVMANDIERKYMMRSPAKGVYVGDAYNLMRDLIDGHSFQFSTREGARWLKLGDIQAVHVSPPCQFYTRGNAGKVTNWPRSIPPTRELVQEMGVPYIIENVKDATYDMRSPVMLCGCMFNLSTIDTDGVRIHLQRPRMFETSFDLQAPSVCDHSAHEWVAGAYGGARRDKYEAKYIRKGGYVPPDKDVVKALLGVEHDMTWKGLFECVPPAYAEFVGRRLMEVL